MPEPNSLYGIGQESEDVSVDEQKKQTILNVPKVIAVGIASPVATILTSRFGVAGTLIGLALSAVIMTVLVDILQAYLARAPATVAKVLPPTPTWLRSVLIAAGISFFVGLIVVTGVEASVGRSLSCWVWNECPTEESSVDGDRASSTSTLPSILGSGPSASSTAPEVRPVDSQQQPTPSGSPETPSVPPSMSPSKVPGTEGADTGASNQGQDQSAPWEEDQQQSSSNTTKEDSPGEDQSASSPNSGNTRKSKFPPVPWTT
jgi:hypothetical protein